MTVTARITVAPDGTISGRAPSEVPAGEHQAVIQVETPATNRRSVRDMPLHDEPWDAAISLRREDLYDEDGRLR